MPCPGITALIPARILHPALYPSSPLLARDVATPQLALHLLGPPINPRHDNWVDPGVKLGAKTTVGAGCIIGPGTSVGDKGSVKRSVVGADCKIGSNAKVGTLCAACLMFRACQ